METRNLHHEHRLWSDMTPNDADLIRTWLFGPGADDDVHEAMLDCQADALILDLEDFTPPAKRQRARGLLSALLPRWQQAGRVTVVRINGLDADGPQDLEAAMSARARVIAYPMASSAAQMQALDSLIAHWEGVLGIDAGSTWILPVCETALGVADLRVIAAASKRIRAASAIAASHWYCLRMPGR